MISVHQAVEWGFGKVVTEFTYLDLKKNSSSISKQYVHDWCNSIQLSNMFLRWSNIKLFFYSSSHIGRIFKHLTVKIL